MVRYRHRRERLIMSEYLYGEATGALISEVTYSCLLPHVLNIIVTYIGNGLNMEMRLLWSQLYNAPILVAVSEDERLKIEVSRSGVVIRFFPPVSQRHIALVNRLIHVCRELGLVLIRGRTYWEHDVSRA